MITGSVTEDDSPEIVLSIAGRDWTAVIDTGFNGDVELPESLRALAIRPAGRVRSDLAGGQTIVEDQFEVRIPFDGKTRKAYATFVAGDGILIGTRLLRDYCLEINFPARTVRLERVSDD